ncbi:hypothetical protein B0O99DRAFT_603501 [Bisporella sp. PMI_857]|nr:hypothetical protein B0O99DRAFT_603501 [Bisporella sp. PMI_857]
MSSLFGMNASELTGPNKAPLSLAHEFKFMFPISLAIIIPTLCLAFSARIRSPILTFITWLGKLMHLGLTNFSAVFFSTARYTFIGDTHWQISISFGLHIRH